MAESRATVSLPNAFAGSAGAESGPMLEGSRLVRLGTDALWIAFIFVACYATTPVSHLGLERLFWLGADVTVLAYLLYQPARFMRVASKNLMVLSWPILACLSTLWSVTAGLSLYHGVQLLLTVLVGLLLCMYASLERIMQLLFFALLATAVLSVLYSVASPGMSVGMGGEWQGLFPHKNVLGHMMALLIITGLCLFLHGWQRRLTACGIALGLALLMLSKSGVGLVAFAIALAPLPLAILVRKGWVAFSVGLGLLLVALSVNLLAAELYQVDVVQYVLDLLGKESTLTGRTLLWEFGWEAYNEGPWLGYGYKGYWESPATTATLLRIVVGQDLWFFHNNFLDVAVAFGTLGLVVLVIGLGFAFFTTIKAFVLDPQYIKLWPVLFLVFLLILVNVENPLFQNHSIHQLLFVVAVVGSQQARRFGQATHVNRNT